MAELMTYDEHRALGRELAQMQRRLEAIAERLTRAYGGRFRLHTTTKGIIDQVTTLQLKLSELVGDETIYGPNGHEQEESA
jgi:predicted nuclease with TOPRIM domain